MIRHWSGIPLGKKKTFTIWAITQNHCISSILHRSKDVGHQDKTVVHLDRNIPLNQHSISQLVLVHSRSFPLGLARDHVENLKTRLFSTG